jgi:hypothetical protein
MQLNHIHVLMKAQYFLDAVKDDSIFSYNNYYYYDLMNKPIFWGNYKNL